MIFKDRIEAGEKLSEKLLDYKDQDVVIYALPRGGVVLGFEIAKRLEAQLDLIIVKKVGHPISPEYAICVVGESDEPLCNESETISVDQGRLQESIKEAKKEVERKKNAYYNGVKPISPKDKIAIIVDDGVATGLTFLKSLQELKKKKPKQIIAALPVVPQDTAEKIKKEVDVLVVLDIPENFLGSVGAYYQTFGQVSDDEVVKLLKDNRI